VVEVNRNILVVDDSKGIQRQLRWAFEGYDVVVAGDREEALAQFRRAEPGVVLLDLGLPPDPGGVTEGLAALQEMLSLVPETRVIIITGDNDRANAVKAVSQGAYDFYQKPVDPGVLSLMVNRAYATYSLAVAARTADDQCSTPLPGVIATSPAMLAVCRTIERIAPVAVTVLLRGDSGTGKERLAQAIHGLSPRHQEKLVAINCAAIPEALLESELFGYEKGAFTGAAQTTIGKIEHAQGGTLFLDEIGDLPLELQAKLLRFLQERVVERVGGRREIPVDVRIVCATHQDLEALMEAGRFRRDLYFRISEVTVNIPPLCEREGDAVILARAFLQQCNSELKRGLKGFDQSALRAIENYAWPGNVRELQSRVRRAAIMTDGSYLKAEDLELGESQGAVMPLNLRAARDDTERKLVVRALALCDNNLTTAANVLGIARPTMYKLLGKYGLKP